MALVLTKLDNGGIEVTGGAQDYTLRPKMHTFRDKSNIDGVKVVSDNNITDVFTADNIEKVVRQDGTEVNISNGDTLYSELKEFFFFLSVSGITEGFDIYVSSNDTEPLNTDADLTGTSGGGSFFTFADLTGIDITSSVGTAVLTKSGNTLEVTTTGTIAKFTLDNGAVFLLTEGDGDIVNSEDATMSASLTVLTWGTGKATAISEGSQISLINFNRYTNLVRNSETFGSWGNTGAASVVEDTTLSPIGDMTADTLTFTAGSSSSAFQARDSFLDERVYTVWVKSATAKKFRLRVDGVSGGVNSSDFTPTASWQQFSFTRTGNGNASNVYVQNEAGGGAGTVDVWGAQWNKTATPSDYIRTLANEVENVVIPEDSTSLGNDVFGNPIARPKLTDGYNMPGVIKMHIDSAIIAERNNANGDNDQMFIKLKTDANSQFICGDDVFNLTTNATGFLVATYNGTALVTTFQPGVSDWFYFNQDVVSGGARNLDIGTLAAFPTANFNDTVTPGTAATTEMIYGNVDTVGISLNGYFSQGVHHPFAESSAEKLSDWTFLKGMVSVDTFDNTFDFTFL